MAISFSEKYEKPFRGESAEKQDKLSYSAAVEVRCKKVGQRAGERREK